MDDANDESNASVQTYHTSDKAETAQASTVMSQALAGDAGVVIVDSQPGK